jgi:hypothetical protein
LLTSGGNGSVTCGAGAAGGFEAGGAGVLGRCWVGWELKVTGAGIQEGGSPEVSFLALTCSVGAVSAAVSVSDDDVAPVGSDDAGVPPSGAMGCGGVGVKEACEADSEG